MCTRFYVEPDTEEIQETIAAAQRSKLARSFLKDGNRMLTSGEIRPTNVVAVMATGKSRQKTAFPMKWGFQIPGKQLIVNARVETAAEKPTFREAFAEHRCVIPASWYYEWEHYLDSSGQKKTGEKYMIQPEGVTMTFLAGLYRIENGFPVFVVLTKEPSKELRKIHDRMPVMLPRNKIEKWISPDIKPESVIPYAINDVMMEKVTLSLL